MDQPAKLPSRRDTKAQVWKTNPEMEKDFIDFCLESAGLHGYKGASLKSWSSVILQLNSKYNQNFDQKALKNKWSYLRHGYMQWRKCCQRTGTGRNEDGTFNWSDEVWEAEIEKDHSLAKFRLEPLKYHNELESLFEGTFAVGDREFNPRRGDPVDIPDDAMHVDGGSDHVGEHFVDVENDAYFSRNLRDGSPGFPSTRDASPGFQSTREDSPAQGSTPVSMRSSGDSQIKGKRKSYEDEAENNE